MPTFRDARVPTGRELLALADVTAADIVDAKAQSVRDAPRMQQAFDATRNNRAGDVTGPLDDDETS